MTANPRFTNAGVRLALALALFLLCGPAAARAAETPAAAAPATPEETRALLGSLLERLSPSLAEAEYTLLPDDCGERNEISFGYLCPDCNRMHYRKATQLLKNQTPLKVPVYAVSPTEFIATDSCIRPEWLDRLEIAFNGKRVTAKIAACCPEQQCVKIVTATPVEGVRALEFVPETPGKRYAFYKVTEDGVPVAAVKPFGESQVIRNLASGKDGVKVEANLLVVNREGGVLGLAMRQLVPAGEKTFSNPADWKWTPAADYEKELSGALARAGGNVHAAQIRLAQRKRVNSRERHYSFGDDDDDEQATEIDALAVQLSPRRVLLLANLNPARTARLEKITIRLGEREVAAEFTGSLRYFHGLVAETAEDLPGAGAELYSGPAANLLGEDMIVVKALAFGRELRKSVCLERIDGVSEGFRGAGSPDFNRDDKKTVAFTRDGKLLTLSTRRRSLDTERYGNECMLPAETLAGLLGDFDKSNVPQAGGEKQAWLGAEFQRLNRELAREKNAGAYTEEGKKGGMVTTVYPGSPAEKMGIAVGDILVSVTPEDSAAPFRLDRYGMEDGDREFPWEEYDRVPAQYYEQLPLPWGSTRNALNKALGNAGIGNRVKLTMVRDGRLVRHDYTVEAEPESFTSVRKLAVPDLKMHVCDLTYEVRHYFKLQPGEKAVLVSRVRAGGKAAIAGLKPYEMIVSVNGAPVTDAAALREQLTAGGEFNLGVRRLAETRIVKIKAEAKAAKPAAGDRKDAAGKKDGEAAEEETKDAAE